MCSMRDFNIGNGNDLYDEPCVDCGEPVEFFSDDIIQNCSVCGVQMDNPRNMDDWLEA